MEETRKLTDTICVSETIYDGQAEQGVELDYVLPDYYPEIFKILSCRLTPRIMSYTMLSDSKLMLDGNVDIKVLYLAEGSNAVHCIEQKYTYTKNVDIGKGAAFDVDDICIKLSSRADYCNCRAVSGRRIDVRGAISTKIHIGYERPVTLPVMPKGIQVKTSELNCCSNIVCTEKQFTVHEDIETGATGICCIMRTAAAPKVNDVRIISDKAIIKGVITVGAAYGVYREDEQGCTEIERMTADIPVSQIIELDGIDDNHAYTAELDVLNCELSCNSDSGIVVCNILAVCRIRCCKESVVQVPVDVFSTEYETEHSMKQLRAVKCCSKVSKQFQLRTSLSADSNVEGVWDCCAEIFNVSCTITNSGELKLTGLISYQALCRNNEGLPCWLEKQEGFEQLISAAGVTSDSIIDITAVCVDADHSIKSDGTLEITAMAEVNGSITSADIISTVDNVIVHEDKRKPHENGYALRICFACGDEDCWDIAKRYSTSVNSILEENEIISSDEKLSGMILIPTI